MTPSDTELRELLLEQRDELRALRQEIAALRKEVAELKTSAKVRAKPQSIATVKGQAPLSTREMSKMMFVSWASRQPLAHDEETAEARQRRLLPTFESSNSCRVVGVDHLRA